MTELPHGDSLRRALTVGLIVVVIDQLTKWWAVAALTVGPCVAGGCIDVIGPLRFNLHYNTGAAFSRGEGLGYLIAPIAVVMSIYLLYLAKTATDRFSPLLFGAIAGGAVGNLIDRVFRAEDGFLSGGVVDFIDFQFWPIFNIADAAIVVGVIVLILHQMREGRRLQDDAESVDDQSRRDSADDDLLVGESESEDSESEDSESGEREPEEAESDRA